MEPWNTKKGKFSYRNFKKLNEKCFNEKYDIENKKHFKENIKNYKAFWDGIKASSPTWKIGEDMFLTLGGFTVENLIGVCVYVCVCVGGGGGFLV